MAAQLGALLSEYQKRLEQAGVFTPLEDAKALLSHALGIDDSAIFASSAADVDNEKKEETEQLIKRREKREPLTRILGETTFYGFPYKDDERYIPAMSGSRSGHRAYAPCR